MQRVRLRIVTEHVRARVQFGKPLADFQAVRFAAAEAAVGVRGLHELAKYTICRPESVPLQILSADALVLRLKAADTSTAGAAHLAPVARRAGILR